MYQITFIYKTAFKAHLLTVRSVNMTCVIFFVVLLVPPLFCFLADLVSKSNVCKQPTNVCHATGNVATNAIPRNASALLQSKSYGSAHADPARNANSTERSTRCYARVCTLISIIKQKHFLQICNTNLF